MYMIHLNNGFAARCADMYLTDTRQGGVGANMCRKTYLHCIFIDRINAVFVGGKFLLGKMHPNCA